jgi:hypothetical protein
VCQELRLELILKLFFDFVDLPQNFVPLQVISCFRQLPPKLTQFFSVDVMFAGRVRWAHYFLRRVIRPGFTKLRFVQSSVETNARTTSRQTRCLAQCRQ